jgi:hypothetical protein
MSVEAQPQSLTEICNNAVAVCLQWERKSLAQAIKYNLDDDRREALYSAWDINNTTKERKLQLVHKVSGCASFLHAPAWHLHTFVCAPQSPQRSYRCDHLCCHATPCAQP